MLFDYLSFANVIGHAQITETFESASVEIKLSTSISEFLQKLFDELKTLSSRDKFELFVDANGNHVRVNDCSAESFKHLKAHIDEFSNESEFEVDLKITKVQVGSTISIYFMKEFCRYLANESLLNLINTFTAKFSNKLLFEVFSTIDPFGSTSIQFFQAGSNIESSFVIDESSRNEKLELFCENATSVNIKQGLLPSDFNLTRLSDLESLNEFFAKTCSVLSLIFLSNSSEIKSNDDLKYKINGYKAVICEGISPIILCRKSQLLYKIYAWAYEGGSNSDKLGLVRNVVSIHLDTDGNIKIDNDVWGAIQSNYQIYLKGNIQSYLEVKNKIGELIIDSTNKTYSMAEELLDSLKNNAFILLTFLLTVVVVNGLKDTGASTVFSDAYLAIVIGLSIISAAWLFMTRVEVMKRYDSASSTMSMALSLNYSKVLMEAEIDECVTPVINRNREYLQLQAKRYTYWGCALLVLFLALFVIGNHIFSSESTSHKTTEAHEPASLNIDKSDNAQQSAVGSETVIKPSPAKNRISQKQNSQNLVPHTEQQAGQVR